MLPTPPIMLKGPYSSLSLLFGPLKEAQIIYNIFVSYKKTKRKNSWCDGLCSTSLVRSMWSLVGLWIGHWDDYSPCALSFASLVIFLTTWVVSWTNPTFKKKGNCFVCRNSGHHAPQCRHRAKSNNIPKANIVEREDIILQSFHK